MLRLFLQLVVLHFLCDFPLQGDFLSRAKDITKPLAGAPWAWAMTAHCTIHAGAVWYLTGWWELGLLEFAAHFAIDLGKCTGAYGFSQDQVCHLTVKLFIAFIVLLSHL